MYVGRACILGAALDWCTQYASHLLDVFSHLYRAAGEHMVKNDALPLVFDKSKPSRLGLMPKGAVSEAGIKWFELPPFMIFHTAGERIARFILCFS